MDCSDKIPVDFKGKPGSAASWQPKQAQGNMKSQQVMMSSTRVCPYKPRKYQSIYISSS